MGVVWVGVALILLGLIAANARTGAVSPRIRNPEVDGATPSSGAVFGYDHWLDLFQIFTIISMMRSSSSCTWLAWRRHGAHPVLSDGHRHDADRLAGPDHELVAVRGVQPEAVALARESGPWSRCRRRSNRSS